MRKRGLLLNKRGQSDDIVLTEIIFIVIVVMFFLSILVFVQKTATSATFYEEVYAKKIGLLIDGSQPGMQHKLDITKAWEVAQKNKISQEDFLNKAFLIDQEKNEVFVKLSDKGGFKFNFFSENEIASNININEEKAFLIIVIK